MTTYDELAQAVLRDVARLERDPNHQRQLTRLEEAQHVECEAEKARRWRALVSRLAPVRAATRVWNFRETAATVSVQDWLRDGCVDHLVLRGGIGCGKTTAACLAVKHWCEPRIERTQHGLQVVDEEPKVSWLRPDDLVSAIKHSYDDAAPRLRPCVVIDDLGCETRPEFATCLCDLLDAAGHTILFTTNLSREQLRKRYDGRVIDRLNDTTTCVDLPAESLRRQTGGF